MTRKSPLSIAVFVSGTGSNLVSIYNEIQNGYLNAEIALVISNKSTAGGLMFAREKGITAIHISPNQYDDMSTYTEELLNLLKDHQVELVVLAGYLKMIPIAVVQMYKNKIINIHPALLPSFGGKGLYGKRVHQAVLDYGCKVSGATVHIVDEEYDTGGPVIQKCVPVLDDDTVETLASRVLEIEHQILPTAIQLFADGKISIQGRRVVTSRDEP